jgi:hypothetical protein
MRQSIPRRRGVRLTLLLSIVASCAPAERRAPAPAGPASAEPIVNAPAPSARANQPVPGEGKPVDTTLRLASIDPAVSVTCDSAATLIKSELSLDAERREGEFRDSQFGEARSGCRFTARGSFKTLPKDSFGPVDLLDKAFIRHDWRHDLRHSADGPDGSDIGVRKRYMLCLVTGSWDGGDDSDTITKTPAPADDVFQLVVECARDVPTRDPFWVPDSVWSLAAAAGLDSVYTISVSIALPPYVSGDFDGDGIADAAVLVENRLTNKTGLAVLHRGSHKVRILAAGSGSVVPDDLYGIKELDVNGRATTPTSIEDRPTAPLFGDALWINRSDSTSGFYIWNGHDFIYEPHRH